MFRKMSKKWKFPQDDTLMKVTLFRNYCNLKSKTYRIATALIERTAGGVALQNRDDTVAFTFSTRQFLHWNKKISSYDKA